MLFNSIDFFLFFSTFFIVYWFVLQKKLEHQNLFIIFSSYIFYGWWDWRFLFLILLSTVTDFFCGLKIFSSSNWKNKKRWLLLSLFVNLTLLAIFKYFNFFIESWLAMFSVLGIEINYNSIKIILPVGISFYTFQTLTYTIDIFKNKIKPTNDFIQFAGFVSFFPQLVAGPIERAKNLLPQFSRKRSFSKQNIKSGVELIIWGLFKKVVIADNLARLVNTVFNDIHSYPAPTILLAALFFSMQIYCDFSGYSDIAIGSARTLGFNMSRNFLCPYFSLTIKSFWNKWHISLSTWFRDYVYITLGGNRNGRIRNIINILVTFLLSGLWHGANWTFVFWGFGHGILLVLERIFIRSNIEDNNIIIKFFYWIKNMVLITILWIPFRANSFADLKIIITKIFQFDYIIFLMNLRKFGQGNNILGIPEGSKWNYDFDYIFLMLISIIIVNVFEYNVLFKTRLFQIANHFKIFKLTLVYFILSLLLIFWTSESNDFIYFQF